MDLNNPGQEDTMCPLIYRLKCPSLLCPSTATGHLISYTVATKYFSLFVTMVKNCTLVI